MNEVKKQLIVSIIVAVLVIILSGISLHYINRNSYLKKANSNVKVNSKLAENSTVVNINDNLMLIDSKVINIEAKDKYHYKLVLETVDNNEESYSYEVKLNDVVIVPSKTIESYNKGDIITLYEGVFPSKKFKLSVILKAYNYNENINYQNKLKIIY